MIPNIELPAWEQDTKELRTIGTTELGKEIYLLVTELAQVMNPQCHFNLTQSIENFPEGSEEWTEKENPTTYPIEVRRRLAEYFENEDVLALAASHFAKKSDVDFDFDVFADFTLPPDEPPF